MQGFLLHQGLKLIHAIWTTVGMKCVIDNTTNLKEQMLRYPVDKNTIRINE